MSGECCDVYVAVNKVTCIVRSDWPVAGSPQSTREPPVVCLCWSFVLPSVLSTHLLGANLGLLYMYGPILSRKTFLMLVVDTSNRVRMILGFHH